MRPDATTRVLTRLSYATAAIALLACDSTTNPGPPPTPKVALISGGNQVAAMGATLPHPILVIATDSAGNGLAGQKITFTVTGGGGSVAPETVTTHSLGYAEATWTLGPIDGPQTMTASVGGGTSILTITATASLPKLVITDDPFDYAYYFCCSLSPTLGMGQYVDAYVGRADFSALSASLPVSFSHSSRIDVPASDTILAGNEFAPFRITGISLGADSLVAVASGYEPLKMGFVVDSGTVRLSLSQNQSTPPRVGQTREVVLCVSPGLPATPVTFSIAADTIIRFATEDEPPMVMSSATLSANAACTYFWVQALAAGSARVTLTNPNYATFTTTLVVAP